MFRALGAAVVVALAVVLAALLLRWVGARIPDGALPADAGELQLVTRELGVAHPPGYPLYTMSAHAFGRLASTPMIAGALGHAEGATGVAAAGSNAERQRSLRAWAWSLGLFSLVQAGATLWLVFRAGSRLAGSRTAGAYGALSLAAAPTFVALSMVPNVRMPAALLTALLVERTTAWLVRRAHPTDGSAGRLVDRAVDPQLVAIAAVAGLALGHHPSLGFLLPIAALAIVVRSPREATRPGTLALAVLAGLLALAPVAYLPVRDAAAAPLAPGDLDNPSALWRHATGSAFASDLLLGVGRTDKVPVASEAEAGALIDRARVVLDIAILQLGVIGLAVAGLGAIRLIVARRLAEVGLLSGAVLVTALLAVLYRAPQTIEYLMPAYVALAILTACGAGAILRPGSIPRPWPWRSRSKRPGTDRSNGALGVGSGNGRARRLARGAALAVLGVVAIWRLVGGDTPMPAAVRDAVPDLTATAGRTMDPECVPVDTEVLAAWHFATPIWYVTRAESRRRVGYVYPDWTTGDPIGKTWLDRAAAHANTGDPVVLTNRTRQIIDAGMPLWPLPGTPFYTTWPNACPDPSGTVRSTATPLLISAPPGPGGSNPDPNADPGGARLIDAVMEPHVVPGTGRPGVPDVDALQALELTLRFEPAGGGFAGDAPVTAFAQLVDPRDGAVWGQFDRSLPADRWRDHRGTVVRARLVPFRGAPSTAMDVRFGAYRSPDGGDPGELRPLEVSSRAGSATRADLFLGVHLGAPPAENSPAGQRLGVPFGTAMVLEDASLRAPRGDGRLRVLLRWRSLNAHASDYTVSVQVEGDGWRAQHDGTPAMGALPTLKWLPGWRVRDSHTIELPPGADLARGLRIGVAVYDAFTLEPLTITDPDRVRAGQGQRAIVYETGPTGP